MGFEDAAPAPFFQGRQFPLGDQYQQVFVLEGDGILGAGPEDVGSTVAIVGLGQQNEGDILVHPLDGGQGVVRAELLLQVPGQEKIPVGALQRFFQVFFRGNAVGSGRSAGVSQQADHRFSVIL